MGKDQGIMCTYEKLVLPKKHLIGKDLSLISAFSKRYQENK